ncbi:acetyl-CoA carboxylase carboxyltransferase subunit alpha [Clostridium sp. A1-XYC3]|uniref:Acetyl-coenzyme A carboxylase carboxyl transferase subunit alpha n=1 Tax=Clostridium tanneri TaxID=3037988 RepID=A0ABU4JU20_9CLOT|nr:acetyl-CoA carboxylase carboxyltransferase subunit alpha [Clostridium sp. A1-XYC3]MDW8801597.1 acetyl-CoA carboxylase carboxyltransferase subunit alpha [Clostridium sp. A1-XYC3]
MEKLEKVQQMISKKLDNKTAWERLSLARMIERPTALDYIEKIFDSFVEFHGDRYFGDDPSVVGGIALLNGDPITIVAHQKGRNTTENIKRNFGSPHPEGYRKGLRLMKQAEKFNRPILCFVDTPGAFCGTGAEERGQGEAIAKNLMEMSSLKVPIITIVIGEGGSGGALAFAVADKVWMLENSIYSILSPEGFASILWKDASRAKEAAEIMKITAGDLKEYGIIDKVLKEPSGGAHKDLDKMSAVIKGDLIECFGILKKQSPEELVEKRYNKFRNMGKYIEI